MNDNACSVLLFPFPSHWNQQGFLTHFPPFKSHPSQCNLCRVVTLTGLSCSQKIAHSESSYAPLSPSHSGKTTSVPRFCTNLRRLYYTQGGISPQTFVSQLSSDCVVNSIKGKVHWSLKILQTSADFFCLVIKGSWMRQLRYTHWFCRYLKWRWCLGCMGKDKGLCVPSLSEERTWEVSVHKDWARVCKSRKADIFSLTVALGWNKIKLYYYYYYYHIQGITVKDNPATRQSNTA